MPRPRVCGAILQADTILMVRHEYEGRAYWTLPGGGVEPHEGFVQAIVREVQEETGLTVNVIRFLFERTCLSGAEERIERCYLLEIVGDQQPQLGFDPEEVHLEPNDRMLKAVQWLSLDKLRADIQVAKVMASLYP